jgi:hypothetical protein
MSDRVADGYPGVLRNPSYNISETVHFNIGNIGTPAAAAPGTPTAAALAFFGQINIHKFGWIQFVHLHLIEDGTAGALNLEVYRRRAGAMTRIAQLGYIAPSADFVTITSVPSAADAKLEPGDYLFCQAVTPFTLANGNGLTVDVHFGAPR